MKRRLPMMLNTGPGAYNIPSTIGKGPSKSILHRHELKQHTSLMTPGPGAYNTDLNRLGSSHRHRYTMSARLNDDIDRLKKNPTPGPGAYQADLTTSISTGASKRIGITMSPRRAYPAQSQAGMAASPGPGQYNTSVADQMVLSNAPKYSIIGRPSTAPNALSMGGTSNNMSSTASFSATTPGPGAYSVLEHDSVGSLKQHPITMKSRHAPKMRMDIPGPGHYNVNVPSNSPKITIAGRLSQYVQNVGSGGSKDISALASSTGALSPGPGAYNIPSMLGKNAPAPSIRARLSNTNVSLSGSLTSAISANHPQNTPGPGAYDVDRVKDSISALKRSPAYSMRPRTARLGEEQTRLLPGPGAYATERVHAVGSNMKSAPTITSRSGTASSTGSSLSAMTPGPGAYNAEMADNVIASKAPKYSIKGRPSTASGVYDTTTASYTPGPGAYNTTLSRSPHHGITLKSRLPMPKGVNTPGPGHYNVALASSAGPKYTMGVRYALPRDDD